MEPTRIAVKKPPKTLAFDDRPVDTALVEAVQRFTNHSVSLAPGLASPGPASTTPPRHPQKTRPAPHAGAAAAPHSRASTAWIMVLLVTLGIAIAGFAAARAGTFEPQPAAETITAMTSDPTTSGAVIVESVAAETDGRSFPNGEAAPIHRFSISAQQASTLHIGESLPSHVGDASDGAGTSETIAAIVIGLCLIGVGMLVISATTPRTLSRLRP